MATVIVTEKPSVARDIAAVLGARERHEGYLRGKEHIVTWAIGHLVRLPEPHEIDPKWKRWQAAHLPMLPEAWPLSVVDRTRDQFERVMALMLAPETEQVVCATDAGREGELIFRYMYEKAQCEKPVKRLWVSSLTPAAIGKAFDNLRDGSEFDALADAARGRSQADWLVGMNLSRAYTLALGDTLSVGRVQTPTLAMVVERDRSIASFVPEDYLEAACSFEVPGDPAAIRVYRGMYVQRSGDASSSKGSETIARLPADGELANAIIDRARRGQASIASVDKTAQRTPPPLLYDLTELQRHANRLYGLSASSTLDVAQALYERHKLISYPRTDSRHLSPQILEQLREVADVVAPLYPGLVAEGTGERPLGPRFIDEARVTDHHAIIPTTTRPNLSRLSPDEQKLYDLIARRFLAAWHEDYVEAVTTVITEITCEEHVDRYRTRGSMVDDMGHRVLDVRAAPKPDSGSGGAADADTPALPPGLTPGLAPQVVEARALSRRTRPPRHFTEATLLTAMETAGRTLDDKALSRAMRERGLGTPATRAAMIETLLAREYLLREGKNLLSTPKGQALIDAVHERVRSPALTGEWERRLKEIERGEADFGGFMADIAQFVRELVGDVLSRAPAPSGTRATMPNSAVPSPAMSQDFTSPAQPNAPPDTSSEALHGLLRERFGLQSFRPHQEEVCRAVTGGEDVLVVMPTGAGKSLCYQLPGIARGGTTLVLSPLIALMEDQVATLQRQGFRAARIHSGRDRSDSRQACVEYLAGRLDYLFIAPERLKVPGFPEMLAKRKPSLIAIDEAHCISHWGHDFRPDYRMLQQRLPLLRPAPIVALTATATPTVQDDIVAQLGATQTRRYIYGFRRTNIAVEVVECAPAERAELIRHILRDPERAPAIVYAPTRKEAERLAGLLSSDLRAAAYHAGMDSGPRDRVQSAFLASELDVIVATIAFGMGIDKPDVRTVIHAALPSSIEGYYQEIGRAGRDGLPSRAVLLHAYADQRTQSFFHTQSYPDPDVLGRVYAALSEQPQTRTALRERLDLEDAQLDASLDKLWVHGGARADGQDSFSRGKPSWRAAYVTQRQHRQDEMERVVQLAQAPACRMLQLVQHFGDQEDDGSPCGQCDVCDPEGCCGQALRAAKPAEQTMLLTMLGALAESNDDLTPPQLARACLADVEEGRALLAALVREGLVALREEAFDKGGRTIRYQRARLTMLGEQAVTSRKLPSPLHIARTAGRSGRTRARSTSAKAAGSDKRERRRGLAEIPAPRALVEALRNWRLEQSRRDSVPAFRVLTDRVLAAVAVAQPDNEEALATISGMGATLRKRYGADIVAIIRDHSS